MTRIAAWIIALAGCAETPSCPQSIADFCGSTSLPCPMTWTAAQAPASWGGCADRNSHSSPIRLSSCGDVNVVEMWGVDASTNYYYDASTGALSSVEAHRATRAADTCAAGTPQLEVCSDPAVRDLCP